MKRKPIANRRIALALAILLVLACMACQLPSCGRLGRATPEAPAPGVQPDATPMPPPTVSQLPRVPPGATVAPPSSVYPV